MFLFHFSLRIVVFKMLLIQGKSEARCSYKIVLVKKISVYAFHVQKCDENRSKIATVRVPHSKTAKMTTRASTNLNFQNEKKRIEQMFSR